MRASSWNWDLGVASLTSATGYSWGSTFASSDQADLLIQEFGIARLLPNDFPALARARAFDPHVSATDVTSRFRTFAAYTQGESERRRLSSEARLVSTGDGPWRWVGGAFFNDAGRSGAGRELTPGLTEFSGVTPGLAGRPVSEPVEYYSFSRESVTERALFGEVLRELGGWRVGRGGRWFGYRIATGNLTEFPYTPAYNSPYEDFDTDDSGVLFRGNVSYRFGDGTNVYLTRSEGYRIGGGNNFRVCTDEEIALLTDDDPIRLIRARVRSLLMTSKEWDDEAWGNAGQRGACVPGRLETCGHGPRRDAAVAVRSRGTHRGRR